MQKPRVAVLGASGDRSKYGNKSVRAHLRQGYDVLPINPKGDPIEGLKTYRSLEEIPAGPLERVSVYLPPAIGLTQLKLIAAAAPQEVWLNPGSESDEIIAAAEKLGLNVIIACSIVDIGTTPDEFGA